MRREVRWWIESARYDFESASTLFTDKKYSNCVLLLHRATEKALKAAIIHFRKEYPRGAEGHRLTKLYGLVKRRVRLSAKLESILNDLSPLYPALSYPDIALGLPSEVFDKEYGEKYLRPVGEMIRWLERKISKE